MSNLCNFGRVTDARVSSLCVNSKTAIDQNCNFKGKEANFKGLNVRDNAVICGDLTIKGNLCVDNDSCPCDDEMCIVGEYDFVIVGGGNAGCVLANRLSEEAGVTVCVIEAGSDSSRIPAESQDLPITDDSVLSPPELTNKTNQWSSLVRKGAFTWGDSLAQGFHQWQWLPKYRDSSDARGCYYSRGSDLGGSTQHAQAWVRADTNDFDEWVAQGNTDWDKTIMREIYKRVENRGQLNNLGEEYFKSIQPLGEAFGFDPAVHSTTGKVDVIVPSDPTQTGADPNTSWFSPLARAFMETSETLPNPDFRLENPGSPGSKRLVDEAHPLWENKRIAFATKLSVQDQLGTDFSNRNNYNDNGVPYPPGTGFGFEGIVSDYQRVSAASSYIYPIQDSRDNLTIKTKTYATKILFDKDKKANCVQILEDGYNVLDCGRNRNTNLAGYGGTPQDAQSNAKKAKCKGYKYIKAKKEVIICGGTFNSPHMLLLSGVGPRKDLEKHDIDVIADVPGVGKHLKDHPEADFFWEMDDINYNAFDSGAGFNGWYPHFPTIRYRSLKNQPPTHALAGQEITDYDMHMHSEVGFSFSIDAGGIVNWNDGRINIRRAGPPVYFHNRTNPENTLSEEKDYRNVTWAIMETHKYTESEGCVRLRSADPCQAPEIIMNWLETESDQDRFCGAFYNWLWPHVELMKSQNFILTDNGGANSGPDFGLGPTVLTPTSTAGTGSWFKEWVWPTPERVFDELTLPADPFTADGSSTITVNHPSHGLDSRFNGLTGTSNHYVRFKNADMVDGNDVNNLYYVTVTDANTYTFDLGTTATAGTYGGASVCIYAFNKTKYIDFAAAYGWGHHVFGTCKMGPTSDPLAVVDQRCRVRGVSGLRVVDLSIGPVSHAANTQTAAYIYGERASDLIKADHPECYPTPEFP